MAVSFAEARPELGIYPTEPLPNGVFKKAIKVGDVLGPRTVYVLDEQIIGSGENYALVRQFILGQHEGAYARNWKRHRGWQDKESIREFYRRQIEGTDEIHTGEVDVSNKEYVFS